MTKTNDALADYWTRVLSVFSPYEALIGPERERLYVERDNSPIPLLIRALRPGRLATKILFTGQMGSGKTSALVRLMHTWSDDYFTVWVDVFASMDVYRISILELLILLGGGISKVALKNSLPVDLGLWHGMVDALSTLVSQITREPTARLDPVELLQGMVCARGDPVEALNLGPMQPPEKLFGQSWKPEDLEPLRVSAVLLEMVARLNQIIADVEKASGRDLLVVVDGLDKMPLDLAESIFGAENSSVLPQIRCRTVYTFPYELYVTPGFPARRHFDQIHTMPNVTLYPRKDREARHEPGYQTMRRVAELRLASVGLDTGAVVSYQDLDRLIRGSGGNMRDFIQLFNGAVQFADLQGQMRIGPVHVKLALEQDQRGRIAGLGEDDLAYLRELSLRPHARPERPILLHEYIVTYIEDGDVWYDVHPSLLSLLENSLSK